MEENLENNEWIPGVRETGFTTPANYFEELSGSINSGIITEKLKSAVQNSGHTVPAHYFDELQSNILAKTIGEPNTRHQPKIVHLWRSNILKYASAACFVIIAGLGIYFNNHHQQSAIQKSDYSDAATEQMLFDIDEQVIIEHIEANYKDQPKANASETELESYILNNYSQNELLGNL